MEDSSFQERKEIERDWKDRAFFVEIFTCFSVVCFCCQNPANMAAVSCSFENLFTLLLNYNTYNYIMNLYIVMEIILSFID